MARPVAASNGGLIRQFQTETEPMTLLSLDVSQGSQICKPPVASRMTTPPGGTAARLAFSETIVLVASR